MGRTVDDGEGDGDPEPSGEGLGDGDGVADGVALGVELGATATGPVGRLTSSRPATSTTARPTAMALPMAAVLRRRRGKRRFTGGASRGSTT
jgi:hypothetical protein